MESVCCAVYPQQIVARKGKWRIVWLTGVGCKLTRRDYEKVHLVDICSQLISVTDVNLTMYSVLLIGVARIFERQLYYMYVDVDRTLMRLKKSLRMEDFNKQQSCCGKGITLADPVLLISSVFGLLASSPDISLIEKQLPLETDFFDIDDDIVLDGHTVAKLDITLPEDCTSSLDISQTSFDFEFNDSETKQDNINEVISSHEPNPSQTIPDLHHPSNNEPLLIIDEQTGQLQTCPKGSPDVITAHDVDPISSPAVFISPLADPNISIGPLPRYQNTPHSFNIPHGVKKHVKRKLTFDTVTQISEKHFERNRKSWMSNSQRKKKFIRVGFKDLFSKPTHRDVFRNSKLLELWKKNLFIIQEECQSFYLDPLKSSSPDELFEASGFSHNEIEILRAGASYHDTIEDGWVNATPVYSDVSGATTINQSNEFEFMTSSIQRSTLSGNLPLPAVTLGFLSPIADNEESDNEDNILELSLENISFNISSTTNYVNKSSNPMKFFREVVVKTFGGESEITFFNLLPHTCNRQTAGISFSHVLELIKQGILHPQQSIPYKEILLKRGDNF